VSLCSAGQHAKPAAGIIDQSCFTLRPRGPDEVVPASLKEHFSQGDADHARRSLLESAIFLKRSEVIMIAVISEVCPADGRTAIIG
jgi:hypothetical protein